MARKLEAGQGGKKGHSNMSHWEGTEVIKKEAKKRRRNYAKKIIKQELGVI
jgi:hypothetical protein